MEERGGASEGWSGARRKLGRSGGFQIVVRGSRWAVNQRHRAEQSSGGAEEEDEQGDHFAIIGKFRGWTEKNNVPLF